MRKRKRGRPTMGTEKRVTTSVRIEPKVKEQIERGYGSVQKYFDEKVNADLAGAREIEVEEPKKKKAKAASVDDF